MDFFEHQEKAHKKTKLLIFYFALAVVCIIAAVYVVGVVTWACATEKNGLVFIWWNPTLLIYTILGVLSVIAIGAGYKIIDLQEGGHVVATMLGGRHVDLNTKDLNERKLLNIVEEMAIASGVPTPEVFILDMEDGLNAFAAGHTISDSVVAVTRPAIAYLTRDELQGVVAHEFSHIFNGDMRLNIRLMGILNGILCIALIGYYIFRSVAGARYRSSNNRGGGGIVVVLAVGVALMAIGYIGVFFAKLIKSAVSRQREFLADASAVQFTRNPGGIIGALKKIGGFTHGSRIGSVNAEQASHFFFADGMRRQFFALMSTHPPLEERIRMIDPAFNGEFPVVLAQELPPTLAEQQHAAEKTKTSILSPKDIPLNVALGLGIVAASERKISSDELLKSAGKIQQEQIYYAQALHASLPEKLKEAAHEIFGARAMIYGLLLNREADIRAGQLQQLEASSDGGLVSEIKNLLPLIDQVSFNQRLPLVDLSIPALRELSKPQYEIFSQEAKKLIEADQSIDLFEYTLQKILFRHLDIYFGATQRSRVRFQSLWQVLPDCVTLFSVLANLQSDEDAQAQAFHNGLSKLNISLDTLPQKLSPEKATLSALDTALIQLADASSTIKRNILYACANIISSDHVITSEESELLRAIADALDCPIPPFAQEISQK